VLDNTTRTKKRTTQEKKESKHGIIVRVGIVDVHRASSHLLLLLLRGEKVRVSFFCKFSRLSFPFFDISFFFSDASSLLLDTLTDRRPDNNRSFAPPPLRKTPMRRRRRRRRNWFRPTPLPSRYTTRVCLFFHFFFLFDFDRAIGFFFSFFGGKLWKKKERERETLIDNIRVLLFFLSFKTIDTKKKRSLASAEAVRTR